MGNQIKFTPRTDKTISDDDAHEIEIIQLKATNRKLISKLDNQKQMIKKLNMELQKLKQNKEFTNINQLKKEYQSIKTKNENLESLLQQSKKENTLLKKELEKFTKDANKSKSSPWDKLKNIRNNL